MLVKSVTSLSALVALPFTGCVRQDAKMLEKPNVIIIYADDIGYGDLSWLGSNTIVTPNVERLADAGIRFTNAYAAAATSTPSRFGMLTGTYPWRKEGTGIAAGDAAMIISPEQYTIADLFKSAGYTTGAIGKWHLGLGAERGKQDWNALITPNLSDIGFDYSFIMAATGDRVPCVYIENGSVVNLDPLDPIYVSYTTPFEGEPTAHTNPEMLTLLPSQGHDQSIIRGISRIGYMKGGKSALWVDEDIADDITNQAVRFIDQNQSKPFFLYVGSHDNHVPRVPHPRFKGKSGMGDRGDAILSFDYTVGRIMDVIDSLGIAHNTIIILSSDNGPIVDDGYHDQAWELLGNHQPAGELRAGKYSIFEAGTRVPFIVKWPAVITKPLIRDGLISQVDLMKSFAGLLKINLPEHAAPDSKDLHNFLTGKSEKGSNFVIQQNLNGTLAIVGGDWKYISPSNAEAIEFWTKTELGNLPSPQLYHLASDIREQFNLAESHPNMLKKLKKMLDKEISKQVEIK